MREEKRKKKAMRHSAVRQARSAKFRLLRPGGTAAVIRQRRGKIMSGLPHIVCFFRTKNQKPKTKNQKQSWPQPRA